MAFCRYVHTARLLHRPCAIIFCSGMLLLNASVAPDLQNVWKPWPVGDILRLASIYFPDASVNDLIEWWVFICK